MWTWSGAAYFVAKTVAKTAVTSFVPGLGLAMDVGEAGYSFYQGDYTGGGISLLVAGVNAFTFSAGRAAKNVAEESCKQAAVKTAKEKVKEGAKEAIRAAIKAGPETAKKATKELSKKIGDMLEKDLAKGLIKDTVEEVWKEGSKMTVKSFCFEIVKAGLSKEAFAEAFKEAFTEQSIKGAFEALWQEELKHGFSDSIFYEAVKNAAKVEFERVNQKTAIIELVLALTLRFIKHIIKDETK